MNILLVNKYYPPHIGGIESHVRDLAEGLVAAGHNVKVLVANTGSRTEFDQVAGVEVVRLGRAFEIASMPVAYGFTRFLNQACEEADIVHFHFPYPWAEYAWWAEPGGVPYVVTYHADIVRQKVGLALYRPIMRRFLNRAEALIVSSPQMVESSENLHSRRDRCRQVNFGLPLAHIAHNPGAVARAATLRASLDGRFIVLFVGRLVYYKGIEVLVDSMPEVDAEFVCIGTGPLRESIVDRAGALGVAERLHLLDPVDDDELAAWYHAADVLALPSVEQSEAFGLVQIEAHAAGTPTVSSDLPTGVTYANLDGVTGLTVKTGSAPALAAGLNRLLDDPDLRTTLGAQAKARALSEFTVEQMVAGTVAVYREAMQAWGRTDV